MSRPATRSPAARRRSRRWIVSLELIREELKANKALLKRGLIEKSRVTALEREEARLDGQRGALVSQIAQY